MHLPVAFSPTDNEEFGFHPSRVSAICYWDFVAVSNSRANDGGPGGVVTGQLVGLQARGFLGTQVTMSSPVATSVLQAADRAHLKHK